MNDISEIISRAEQGDKDAQFKLVGIYYYGDGVQQDVEKAAYWCGKAAEQGAADAQAVLGIMYAKGDGLNQDWEKAAYWDTKAAEQGNAAAQSNLGHCYAEGNGVEQDYEKAKYWITKAAEQGDSDAKESLVYLNNMINAEQEQIAIAEKGDPNFQALLALNYAGGKGAPRNPEKAFYWFTKAAEQGDVIAQVELGVCYLEGNGVKQDFEKAKLWLTKAAAQDNDEADEAKEILKSLSNMQSTTQQAVKKGDVFIVPGNDLFAKFAWLKSNVKSNSSYIFEVSADECIRTRYQSLSFHAKSNVTITLRGKDTNRTIDLFSDGCMFLVGESVTLVLDNNITLLGRSNNTHTLVAVSGTLIMNAGSVITGNKNTSEKIPSGGVFVLSGGVFIMNGGIISENKTNLAGGGVGVRGTFTMNDGTISGNSSGSGGGVSVGGEDSSFTMNGGTICGNTSPVGGGVFLNKGTFIMSGGTISGNTAEMGAGGVFVDSGLFTMSGGTISGNIAGKSGGGGVYILGAFNKIGGTIIGYASDTANGNVVKDSTGTAMNSLGHAIAGVFEVSGSKYKDTTSLPADNLSFNAGSGEASGSWSTTQSQPERKSSGGCYIATCVYGSYDCPQVWTLRRYRDVKLSTSWFGRCFIQIYYTVSPKIVKLFGNMKWFNRLWKSVLNKLICKLQNSGIDCNPYSD